MSEPKRISPAEAKQWMDEGWTYLDVRSEPEFADDHPAGAFNVPLLHMGPGGMTPNHDFLAVVEANFPKDAKIVLGCRTGNRSLKAANRLVAEGFTSVVDQRAGMAGIKGSFGETVEQGWTAEGLPTQSGAPNGRSYADLKAK